MDKGLSYHTKNWEALQLELVVLLVKGAPTAAVWEAGSFPVVKTSG